MKTKVHRSLLETSKCFLVALFLMSFLPPTVTFQGQSALLYASSPQSSSKQALASSEDSFQERSGPWKNLPKKKTLENGLTLIYQQDDSSAITVFQILLNGGKGAEPPGKSGLSYLTTRLAMEIPDQGKVQDLMAQASTLSLTSKEDYSLINIQCLSENLEETLKIVSKIVQDPLFSGLRIDWVKKFMLAQGKTERDDSINLGHLASLKAFFGKDGYGNSSYGTEESLKNINKRDIENFYENIFNSKSVIFSVCSDLDESKIIGLVEKYFSKLPPPKEMELLMPSSSFPEQKEMFIEKEAKQSYVSLSFPLPEINLKNFVLAAVLENLLGKGPGSRLWQLRTKERLAYNINAVATQTRRSGIFEVYLETEVAKTTLALKALRDAVNKLFEEGVSQEEFELTKAQTKSQFLRANEAKEVRAKNVAFFEAVGLGCEFLTGFFSEVDSLSLEELNSCIKEVLNPEKAIQIVVGSKLN